jgi:hypothetical protein
MNAKSSIFQPALDALAGSDRGVFGPTSFQDYLAAHRLERRRTAESISIDSLERLPKSLKRNDAMVFRLGASLEGIGTQFAIAKVSGHIEDFFLIDEKVFDNKEYLTFIPEASSRRLFSQVLFQDISESSLLSFGFASGAICHALGLNPGILLSSPATGKSVYTFELKLHSVFDNAVTHERGQVEIDALFVERRDGKDTLFVIEAKTKCRSLAKHKLVYPVLALAPHIPKDMPIIPVYVKMSKDANGLHYNVVECEIQDPRTTIRAIDDLRAKSHAHLVLPE